MESDHSAVVRLSGDRSDDTQEWLLVLRKPGELKSYFEVPFETSPNDEEVAVHLRLHDDAEAGTNFVLTAYVTPLANANHFPPPASSQVEVLEDDPAPGTVGLSQDQTEFLQSLALDVSAVARTGSGRVALAGSVRDPTGGKPDRLRIILLDPEGRIDPSFRSPPLLVGIATALAIQSDGQVLVGGQGLAMDATQLPILVRLSRTGELDTEFQTHTQAEEGLVNAIAALDTGEIWVAGKFTSIGGGPLRNLVRLTRDGRLDLGFDPGSGPDGEVRALLPSAGGGLILGGDFSSYNAAPSPWLARIRSDGAFDDTFLGGARPNAKVRCLADSADGGFLVGGDFGQIGTMPSPLVARFSANDMLQPLQLPPLTKSRQMRALLPLAHGELLLGGDFAFGSEALGKNLILVGPDGMPSQRCSLAVTPDSDVTLLAPLGDFHALIAGRFSQIGSLPIPRLAAVKLCTPAVPEQPLVAWVTNTFTSYENGLVARVGLSRLRAMEQALTVRVLARDGTARAEHDYRFVGNEIMFRPGEKIREATAILPNNIDFDGNRHFFLSVDPAGAYEIEGATEVRVVIQDDDLGVSVYPSHLTTESDAEAVFFIKRNDSIPGTCRVSYRTVNGTAQEGLDFVAVSGDVELGEGVYSVVVRVPILRDGLVEGDETFSLRIENHRGVSRISESAEAELRLTDNDASPTFSPAFYGSVAYEAQGKFEWSMQRNDDGLDAWTQELGIVTKTARLDVDYPLDTVRVILPPGQGQVTPFSIPLIDDCDVEPRKKFSIRMLRPVGSPTGIPQSQMEVELLDDDGLFGDFPLHSDLRTGLDRYIAFADGSGVGFGRGDGWYGLTRVDQDFRMSLSFSTNALLAWTPRPNYIFDRRLHEATLLDDGSLLTLLQGAVFPGLGTMFVDRLAPDGMPWPGFTSFGLQPWAEVDLVQVDSDTWIVQEHAYERSYEGNAIERDVTLISFKTKGSAQPPLKTVIRLRNTKIPTPGGPELRLVQAESGGAGFYGFGSFDAIGGKPTSPLVRFSADGSIDSRFEAGSSATLRSLTGIRQVVCSPDGTLYVLGIRPFQRSDGTLGDGGILFRLNEDGSEDSRFRPYQVPESELLLSSGIVLLKDGSLLVGREPVKRLLTDGSKDLTWPAGLIPRHASQIQELPSSRLFYVDDYGAHRVGSGLVATVEMFQLGLPGARRLRWYFNKRVAARLQSSEDLRTWTTLHDIQPGQCRGEYLDHRTDSSIKFYRVTEGQ